MKKKYFSAIAFAALYMMTLPMLAADDADLKKKAEQFMKKSDLVFIENKGQVKDSEGKTRDDIKYIARSGNVTVYFQKDRVSYVFTERKKEDVQKVKMTSDEPSKTMVHRMDMHILNSEQSVLLEADNAVSTNFNYYSGAQKNIEGLQGYRRIIYKGIYPKTDLVFSSTGKGIKYEYIVHPGGDWTKIAHQYEGNNGLSIDRGSLRIKFSMGDLEEEQPYSYQVAGNVSSLDAINEDRNDTKYVSSKYVLNGNIVSYDVSNYREDQTLVIDPKVDWATYYGSAPVYNPWLPGYEPCDDYATSVAVDGINDIIMVGYTNSPNFPVSSGFQWFNAGNEDAFVVKFSNAGTLRWATYYGGYANDRALSVSIGAANVIAVTGWTESPNLSVPGGFQTTIGGGRDAFVAHIASLGTLNWATFIGGDGTDEGQDITTVNFGNSFAITGFTNSFSNNNFPAPVVPFPVTAGAEFNANQGQYDAFLTMLTAGLNAYTSYLGGSDDDFGMGIVGHPDSLMTVVLTGYTESANFPVQAAFQSTFAGAGGGSYDAFLTKWSPFMPPPAVPPPPPLWQLIWSTYYGDTGDDRGMDVCFLKDALGFVGMVGYSSSATVPVSSSTNSGGYDVLLKVFDYMPGVPTLGVGLYGGSGNDYGYDVAADAHGYTVTGETYSIDYPMHEEFQGMMPGFIRSALVTRFNRAGMAPELWSSYYHAGNATETEAQGVAIDGFGRSIIVGSTKSWTAPPPSDDLKLRHALYSSRPGGWDAFIAVFSDSSKFPTYLGGSNNDRAYDIAYSAIDNSVVVTGYTESLDFPNDPGTTALSGTRDAFVSKFDGGGNYLWSMYYGGSGNDEGHGIAVNSSGDIAIAGVTNSTNLPTSAVLGYTSQQAAIVIPPRTGNEGFMAKFDKDGNRYFATYISGDKDDAATDVDFDSNGDIVVVGYSASNANISTAGSVQPNYSVGMLCQWLRPDAFVIKYAGTGARSWGTYAGGGDEDKALGVKVDPGSGDIYVTGYTRSIGPNQLTTWPQYGASSPDAQSTNPNGCATWPSDVILVKYASAGTSPWSIRFGDIPGAPPTEDVGTAVSFASGYAFVTGYTTSSDNEWASTATCTTCPNPRLGDFNIFLSKYDASTGIKSATRLYGDAGQDVADAIDANSSDVVITGYTSSSPFPNRLAGFQTIIKDTLDAFVSRFRTSNITPLGSTYYGGTNLSLSGHDYGTGVTRNNWGQILICGWTTSNGNTNVNDNIYGLGGSGDRIWSYQPDNASVWTATEDAFIARIVPDLSALGKDGDVEDIEEAFDNMISIDGLECGVSPNPSTGSFQFTANLTEASDLELTLTDVLGRSLMSISEAGVNGTYSKKVDISNLPDGMYLLKVRAGEKEGSVKILKQ